MTLREDHPGKGGVVQARSPSSTMSNTKSMTLQPLHSYACTSKGLKGSHTTEIQPAAQTQGQTGPLLQPQRQ